jgi:hypothetical protein
MKLFLSFDRYPTIEGNIESLGESFNPIELVRNSVEKNKQWKKLHNKKKTGNGLLSEIASEKNEGD